MSKLNNNSDLLPYEKCMRYGPEALSDTELLAVIIRTGTTSHSCIEVAGQVLEKSGDLGILGLRHLSMNTLMSIEGIGSVKATMLRCIGELSSRIVKADKRKIRYCKDSALVADYYMEQLRHLDRERFILMLLDNKCGLIHESVLSIGTVNYTCLSARDIFADALNYGAVQIILVHNHPSGDPSPSIQDIETTRRIVEAGKLLGIGVIDHVIIGDNCYLSFLEKNLLGKE